MDRSGQLRHAVDVAMKMNLLISPPIAFLLFFILISLGYRFLQKHAAKGLDHPEKYLPYSGGQKIPPVEVRLSYKAFFRLGLLFGIVHVAVLVLATLPLEGTYLMIGLIFVAGISISVAVLARIDTNESQE